MRVMQQISLVAAKRIIEQQNAELRATLSNRDKMYSVIAHDLRSPMASIRMVLNLVVASVSPDVVGQELFELLDKANRESEDVHDLLDNLLKWTKSQTGRLSVVTQDLDLCDIIPGVVDIFEVIAATKKIKLNLQPSDEKLIVRADNDMLKTVVRNFMSNAVKFSPEGSTIHVDVKCAGGVEITIRDEGVGIAPEELPNIFEKFYKSRLLENEKGSGLGLAIAKYICEKHNGTVRVESELGKGTAFTFVFGILDEKQA